MQLISQLTNLTALVIANSEEQQMGGIFGCVSGLTNLRSLGITCFRIDHFAAASRLPLLEALTVDFGNETAECDSLRRLARMTWVHHLWLKAKEQVRDSSFGRNILDSWRTPDGCVLQLHVTARNEEAAMKAVGKMTSVWHVMVQDIRDPCNIWCLDELPGHCWLYLTCVVGNELLQQVARLCDLKLLFIQKYSGDASGLLWEKHMPNLELLEFGSAVDDTILQALPKKLLKA